ncbi:MAG: hypothetical protein AAFZ15_25335 [Bacteroidota bacterium]
MKNTKEIFEAITANQHKLAETLNENTHRLMELAEPDHSLEKLAKDTTALYLAEGKAYFDNLTKSTKTEDALKTVQTAFSKFMDTQMEVYNKTSAFYQGWFKKYNLEKGQERFKEATEIYQDSFQAITETATANVKAMQELMK